MLVLEVLERPLLQVNQIWFTISLPRTNLIWRPRRDEVCDLEPLAVKDDVSDQNDAVLGVSERPSPQRRLQRVGVTLVALVFRPETICITSL